MRLFTSALAVFAFLLVSAFAPVSNELEIGAAAPMTDFEMMGTDGEAYSLESVAGENGVLVVFSCHTCPYVIAWEDRYNALAEHAAENGIGMIAVNSNEAYRDGDDSMEAMQEHAAKNDYQFPYVVDQDHQLADAFGATRTPHVFLFDGDMELVYRGAIDDSPRDKDAVQAPYLMNALSALGQGGSIDMATTRSVGCSIKRLG
jgi:peroxiredoxin